MHAPSLSLLGPLLGGPYSPPPYSALLTTEEMRGKKWAQHMAERNCRFLSGFRSWASPEPRFLP